jgi:hypothetical protein
MKKVTFLGCLLFILLITTVFFNVKPIIPLKITLQEAKYSSVWSTEVENQQLACFDKIIMDLPPDKITNQKSNYEDAVLLYKDICRKQNDRTPAKRLKTQYFVNTQNINIEKEEKNISGDLFEATLITISQAKDRIIIRI